jgi:hypothetical protein
MHASFPRVGEMVEAFQVIYDFSYYGLRVVCKIVHLHFGKIDVAQGIRGSCISGTEDNHC